MNNKFGDNQDSTEAEKGRLFIEAIQGDEDSIEKFKRLGSKFEEGKVYTFPKGYVINVYGKRYELLEPSEFECTKHDINHIYFSTKKSVLVKIFITRNVIQYIGDDTLDEDMSLPFPKHGKYGLSQLANFEI